MASSWEKTSSIIEAFQAKAYSVKAIGEIRDESTKVAERIRLAKRLLITKDNRTFTQDHLNFLSTLPPETPEIKHPDIEKKYRTTVDGDPFNNALRVECFIPLRATGIDIAASLIESLSNLDNTIFSQRLRVVSQVTMLEKLKGNKRFRKELSHLFTLLNTAVEESAKKQMA